MNPGTAKFVRIANAIAVVLCIAWFLFDPDFEPVITGLLVAAGFMVPLGTSAAEPKASIDLSTPSMNPLPTSLGLSPELGGHQHSIAIHKGDLLVLNGTEGTVVVRLDYSWLGKVNFQWRHAKVPRGEESMGSGELYEQYVRTHRFGNVVTNVGSKLFIKAGPYKIEWSKSSRKMSYVYPRGNDYFAYVMPNTSLNAFRL